MSFAVAGTDSEFVVRHLDAEARALMPAAMHTAQTRGRRFAEPSHPYRTAYMRDRDRIIHCASFRRLLYKTQVFVGQPSDHQRTRLTHTLEVAQIARTVARNLRLNEDLTEAIALAHDLGHPPFGHAGERALASLMADHGGFEHNRQGLRLLEHLESRYPEFAGLNLSFEILQSVALHSSERSHFDLAEFGPALRMLAESQVVDVADSIAYTTHDLDDALRAGLISHAQLSEVEMWRIARERAGRRHGTELAGKPLSRAVIRALVDWQVSSLLDESRRRLDAMPDSVAVQHADSDCVSLDPQLQRIKGDLEHFLFENVYRHEEVTRTTTVAERMVRQLFGELRREPSRLPEKYRVRFQTEGRERVICDYVAGMTDRYAQRLYRELFEP